MLSTLKSPVLPVPTPIDRATVSGCSINAPPVLPVALMAAVMARVSALSVMAPPLPAVVPAPPFAIRAASTVSVFEPPAVMLIAPASPPTSPVPSPPEVVTMPRLTAPLSVATSTWPPALPASSGSFAPVVVMSPTNVIAPVPAAAMLTAPESVPLSARANVSMPPIAVLVMSLPASRSTAPPIVVIPALIARSPAPPPALSVTVPVAVFTPD